MSDIPLEKRVNLAWEDWQNEACRSSSWSWEREKAAMDKYLKLKQELEDKTDDVL